MKKILAIVLAAAMMLSASFSMAEGAALTAGTYEKTAQGMGGNVKVTVTVDANGVTAAAVDVSMETAGYGADHRADFEQAILASNGAEIDTIAGCTVSSNAVNKALAEAMAEARGEAAAEEAARSTEADVIVVGAGAAGLAAAAKAAEAGASVILIETNAFAGGATATSGGNFLNIDAEQNAQEDRNDAALEKYAKYTVSDFPEAWQPYFTALTEEIEAYKNNGVEKGAFDSVNRAVIDHFISGDGYDLDGNRVNFNTGIVFGGLEANQEVKAFLLTGGMTIKPGSSAASHFNAPNGKGSEMIESLLNAAVAAGADVQYNTRAKSLVVTDGRVTGVVAESEGSEVVYTAAKGVVLATGGYTSNTAMCAEYQNVYTGLTAANPSNQPASIQGDGILMAQAIGADINDMAFVTTMLKGYNNQATSGEETNIYAASQLTVNVNGERFIDDKPASGPAAKVRYALNDQPEAIMFSIGDQKMIDGINEKSEGLADKLIERGIAWKADTLEEACALAGLDTETVKATVEKFNGYVDAGVDAEFGRTEFNGKVEEGPFYICKLQSAYHLTFGGLTIDTDMHVLTTDGSVIDGLYAAGDVVGNFEGVIHQSGFCLTIVVWTGMVAGANAAA